MADAGALEERTIEVNVPDLSAEANHRLTEAVRTTLGTDSVEVPADRPYVSRGEASGSPWYAKMGIFKAATIGYVAVAVGVGLIILTTGDHWWILAIAVIVLLFTLASVTRTIIGLASVAEYPDPFLVAYLSEQGVHDPEALFTALVAEFTPLIDHEHRRTPVEDDPAQASAEQQSAVTPGGGPSSAVGPGN